MGADKDVKDNIETPVDLSQLYTIRRCTLDDLDGVISVNEKELPEDCLSGGINSGEPNYRIHHVESRTRSFSQ